MKLPSIHLLDRLAAEGSLSGFIKQFWDVLEPGTPISWGRHLDVLCEYLEALSRGDILRLIINAAPRSMKSINGSVMFPCWHWVRRPEAKFLFASYAAVLALKHSRDRRSVITSDLFKKHWPTIRLKDDAARMGDFENSAQGAMRATSVGGHATGLGGGILIADDLINPQQADSEAERSTSLRWFLETFQPRQDDKKTGRFLVLEQRTNQQDLTGYLLANQTGWTVLSLPSEFERRTVYSLPSGKESIWEEGGVLWPEREGRVELDAAKERVGSFAYKAQYLQAPTAREGNLFQAEWLREYHDAPLRFDKVVMSLDTAFSTKATADYSAAVVVGLLSGPDGSHAPGFYILRAWRGRVTFGDLKATAIDLFNDHSPDEVLVEAKASGMSLIQELQADTILPVKGIDADVDKLSRANAVTPLFESGRVFVPEDQPWLQNGQHWVGDLKEELLSFPAGRHDDLVDALVHALANLRHVRNPAKEWMAAQQQADPARIARLRTEAEARAMSLFRTCDVCGRSIPVIQHQSVYRAADGVGYVHKQCFGKPAARRTETVDGSQWPGPKIGGQILIPNSTRLR
jgi:predicted phage terminase large subunit-like protein